MAKGYSIYFMLLFGLSEDTWLIIALAFLSLSTLGFLWVWWSGFSLDKQSGKNMEYPWE